MKIILKYGTKNQRLNMQLNPFFFYNFKKLKIKDNPKTLDSNAWTEATASLWLIGKVGKTKPCFQTWVRMI